MFPISRSPIKTQLEYSADSDANMTQGLRIPHVAKELPQREPGAQFIPRRARQLQGGGGGGVIDIVLYLSFSV